MQPCREPVTGPGFEPRLKKHEGLCACLSRDLEGGEGGRGREGRGRTSPGGQRAQGRSQGRWCPRRGVQGSTWGVVQQGSPGGSQMGPPEMSWPSCLPCSPHQGHALHLRDLWEVLQTQHVSQGALPAALRGEAVQMRGESTSAPGATLNRAGIRGNSSLKTRGWGDWSIGCRKRGGPPVICLLLHPSLVAYLHPPPHTHPCYLSLSHCCTFRVGSLRGLEP